MNVSWIRAVVLVAVALLGAAGRAFAQDRPRDDSKPRPRMVLVELYTSQGCDMCPTAEKILGAMAERDRGIVPIAFHVDYFNDPWKDVFSDPLYSQRQMTYNQLYTKPKNAEYGLYYTPMLMIDGEQSVNGRDRASAEAAIRQALARKPGVRARRRPRPQGRRALGDGHDQGHEPVGPGREVAAPGLRRAPRGRRRHRHPVGRERGQVARRAIPGAPDEIRVHRARRQVARDATVLRSRSSRRGTAGTSGWPCSSRTSAPAWSTRRPTSPGDRPRPTARRRLRRPGRRRGALRSLVVGTSERPFPESDARR